MKNAKKNAKNNTKTNSKARSGNNARNAKLKNEVKSAVYKFALRLLLLVVMIYSLFQYSKTMGSAIETETADLEIRQDIVEIYGYLFRNEELIYSPGGSSVNYLIEDGRRVGRNQEIARAHQSFLDLSAKEQIDNLDQRLYILRRSNINLDFVAADITRIDRDANEIYAAMLKNISGGRFREAGRNRDEMLILLNRKQLITGVMSSGSFDSIIAGAEAERAQFSAQNPLPGAGGIGVNSNRSGIFYSRVDGYENYFTAEAVHTLDFDKFEELINKRPDGNILNGALGKVAYDFNWYLAARTEKINAVDFIVGRTYNIIYPFSHNKSVESVLIRQIDSAASNEVILIFETNFIPFDFDFSRKQTVQIVFNEITGIKVPEEALHVVTMEDGTAAEGVFVRHNNLIVFRELPRHESLGKFNGYYLYLEPSKRGEGGGTLQLYEEIIIEGRNLYDGRVIE